MICLENLFFFFTRFRFFFQLEILFLKQILVSIIFMTDFTSYFIIIIQLKVKFAEKM